MTAAASNTRDCFREAIGHTIVGVLFNALPINRRDLASGNKTLVFDDGTGLTISDNGSFWRESKSDIDRAIRLRERELRQSQQEIEEVLTLAGRPSS